MMVIYKILGKIPNDKSNYFTLANSFPVWPSKKTTTVFQADFRNLPVCLIKCIFSFNYLKFFHLSFHQVYIHPHHCLSLFPNPQAATNNKKSNATSTGDTWGLLHPQVFWWLLGSAKSSSPGDKFDCHQRFLAYYLSSSYKTNKPCSNTISSISLYSILQHDKPSNLESLLKPLIFTSPRS